MHGPEPGNHTPLRSVTPRHIQLGDGANLEFIANVPDDAAQRRAAVHGSALYGFVGPRLDLDPPASGGTYIGGYIGKSDALAARADTSWCHWIIAQRAIAPVAMVLLHPPARIYDRDALSVTESRVIARLSTDMGQLCLTNTHTSAETAASRLGDADLTRAVRLGDTIAHHIWGHALAFHANPWPAPAPNMREAAIRVIQRASTQERRGIDLMELCARLEANGYPSAGRTRWRSVRRDVADREQRTRAPRAHATAHRNRVIFWSTPLTKVQALAAYDAAHPLQRPTPTRWARRSAAAL